VPCVADMGDQVRMSMSFVFDLHEMESISTSMLHPDIFVQNRPPLATTQYIQPHSVFPSPSTMEQGDSNRMSHGGWAEPMSHVPGGANVHWWDMGMCMSNGPGALAIILTSF
jgi:hypothetical protein